MVLLKSSIFCLKHAQKMDRNLFGHKEVSVLIKLQVVALSLPFAIAIYSQTCFKRPSIQVTWTTLLTGGCLLLNESGAESMHKLSAPLSCSNKQPPV